MSLASISLTVKTRLKFDSKAQLNKFKKFMAPYHEQGLKRAKEALKNTIVEKDAYTSGTLFESVFSRTFSRNSDILQGSIGFDKTASGYAYFADQGRRPGKMPPIQKIEEWKENLRGGEDISSYAVALKISKVGTEGKKFYKLGKRRAQEAYRQAIRKGIANYKGQR